jgi:hypothetical protein
MQFGVHYSLGVNFFPAAEDYAGVAQRGEARTQGTSPTKDRSQSESHNS